MLRAASQPVRLPIPRRHIMTIRLIGSLLCGGLLMFVTATAGFAEKKKAQTTQPEPAASTTTVKSSKSNTSDRMGGGGGKGTAQSITGQPDGNKK